VLNFNRLGLKKLIATCYAGSCIANRQLSFFDIAGTVKEGRKEGRKEESRNIPYKAVVTTVYDTTGDGSVDMLDVAELFRSGENSLTELRENGDFRSDECLALLDEADIVVTNPPFSLFREYVATLIEHEKKFIIIGNQNAVTYKEIFPLLRDNKMWLGSTMPKEFLTPDLPEDRKNVSVREDGSHIAKFGNICWFTNLDFKKRHEEMILFKRYSPENYPKYDNYDAINVDNTADIPCDYDGVMGVPITFLNKYSPDQFEIVGCSESEGKGFSGDLWDKSSGVAQPVVKERRKYKRLFIKIV
ncbi:MAG: adenine-specific methyltransferase EcoRI family protein, partial [Desulfovibrionaceae bacterium]|nr:adenine-specific methyltransferase EcoRI family protein [Desulfovibrionaceae bacterium]